MPEITIKAIEALLDDRLEPINTKLSAIEETVNNHTTQLDNIAKDVKLLLEEKPIAAARLDRLEKWAEQAGEIIGVKLDLKTIALP